MDENFETYLQELQQNIASGIVTEHSHRAALQTLLETRRGDIAVINEPKHIACGAPDYVITRDGLPIGYVEAKDVDANLNKAERSAQLQRYRAALDNLILTDYLEFRWYTGGEWQQTARLARRGKGDKLVRDEAGAAAMRDLLHNFFTHAPQPIATPHELAARLARLTHLIRDIIVEAFTNKQVSATLRDLRQAFTIALIPDLNQPRQTGQFADMYAQTIAYGLFAARCNHQGAAPFRRLGAAREIPKTNPFLRQLFETITGTALDDEPYVNIVNDLVRTLAHADIAEILAHFGRRTRREDPVVHFYETFLTAYDPQLRERRGVYYTPTPVVSYIVRSVDYLLRDRFGLSEGLADRSMAEGEAESAAPRVLILDPAAGTGTFLYAVIDHIRERFMAQGNLGLWSGYVREYLLPRLFGFELLMAPYAVAHLKLGLQLAGQDLSAELRAKWAYDFASDDRLGIYLTNTLEAAEREIQTLFGPLRVITEEANAAARIKRDLPIMVIIGNPPYSGHSANRSWETDAEGKRVRSFSGELLRDYYYVDGEPLGERNPKWLQDDYVKFIRWAQWRIARTGAGVVGFVTNHSYLDNPTFRGMRQNLMRSFSEIYIYNLHGNSRRKEKNPDGGVDDNIFNIQQGVAVLIGVKREEDTDIGRVYHADLWGARSEKYKILTETNIEKTTWTELQPISPFYLFIPQNWELKDEYDQGWRVTDIFLVNSMGITTGDDNYFVAFSKKELKARFDDVSEFVTVAYHPFDNRQLFYAPALLARARFDFMRHLQQDNLALATLRRSRNGSTGNFFVTNKLTDKCIISSLDNAQIFPLYLYPNGEFPATLFDHANGRRPNLSAKFIEECAARLNMKFVGDGAGDLQDTFGPEDIFHYVYAVFHSPTYRARYAEFLKLDFPRLPLTTDRELFAALVRSGAKLVALHLLKSPALAQHGVKFPEPGNNEVEKPRYTAPRRAADGAEIPGRVYINATQYFEGIEPEIWEFRVGGYQVLHKWLKDRRERALTIDELYHYPEIVAALRGTLQIMAEIAELNPAGQIT